MLDRRQMLTHVAGGMLLGSAGIRAAQASSCHKDRSGWLPQLSKSAQTMVEAETRGSRFQPGLIHRTGFLPGITLLACKATRKEAEGKLRLVQSSLRRKGLETSTPGVSRDGKMWILFVCAESNEVNRALGSRAGRVRPHLAKTETKAA